MSLICNRNKKKRRQKMEKNRRRPIAPQLELFPLFECYDPLYKHNRLINIEKNINILKKPRGGGDKVPPKTTPISSGLRGISPQRKHGGEADKMAGIKKMTAKKALISP